MANDQIQLNPELVDWLKARQASLKIVKTTTTPSGQTIDWVPIESQQPSGKIATAPPYRVGARGSRGARSGS
jgi:surface antigen